MGTITIPRSAAKPAGEAKPRTGFARRMLTAIFESRRMSAERMVAVYLERLSQERLADLGFSTGDIDAIRARARQRWNGPAL